MSKRTNEEEDNSDIKKKNTRINGLDYIEDFITEEESKILVDFIDKQEWNKELKRRTQHYGYMYDYKKSTAIQKTTSIPDEFEFLIKSIYLFLKQH